MSLTDDFDRIYVINLPERTDRRKAVTRELGKFRLRFTDPQVRLFSAIRCHEACGFPSAAVRGCFQSHLTILKEARSGKLRNVLIMEDDLAISPLVSDRLKGMLQGVSPSSWDIMYLGHIQKLAPVTTPRFLPYEGPIGMAHFYAVNARVFDRLIAFLERMQARPMGDPLGGPMHYDGALCTFREQNPDICTLIAQPSLGWQRSSRSDIHAKWYERVIGLRQAADLGRALRQRAWDLRSGVRGSRPGSSTLQPDRPKDVLQDE